ncbi:MAG: cob(I)yrinic acid a,c-diamide adenosyltransferase [Chthonomonas sp.]|nr:cob(I)yrinic acid a,c-diamide adenosyltransferase [Chthonomonas sp.]
MKIYTKSGDAGETGLYGPQRVPKTDPRIQAVGHLDELNSHLGVCVGQCRDADVLRILKVCQSALFDIGAEIASVDQNIEAIHPAHIDLLEHSMDQCTAGLPELRTFILPGGSPGATALHVARTVCRRAERELWRLHETHPVRSQTFIFLNRLSDWIFTAARWENHCTGCPDIEWQAFSKETL